MATNARTIGPLTQQIVAEIRAALARLNWTQAQLSERSGIPMRTLEKILRLDRALDVEQLAAIADAFGLAPDKIMAVARTNSEIYTVDGRLNPAHTRGVPPSDSHVEELISRRRSE